MPVFLLTTLVFFSGLFFPAVAAAQEFAPFATLGTFLQNIIQFINDVVIPFILGIGFLYFVWGIFLYFIKGAADPGAQDAGKSVFIYATGGFVLIFIFWGVVTMLSESTGLALPALSPALIPAAPGPQL